MSVLIKVSVGYFYQCTSKAVLPHDHKDCGDISLPRQFTMTLERFPLFDTKMLLYCNEHHMPGLDSTEMSFSAVHFFR